MNWTQFSACVILTFLAVAAEAGIGLPRLLLGTQLALLPPVIVYCAVKADLATLITVVTLGGVWTDSLSANPLGVTMLPLLVTGLVIRGWRELLLQELTYAQVVLGLLASAAVPVLSVLLLMSMGERPLLGLGSAWQLLVVSLTGAALTPPCFRLLDLFERLFAYKPEPETVFRKDREIKRGRS